MQLTEEEQAVVSVIFHNRVEEDIQCFMDHRLSMFGSDGNAVSKNGFYKDGKPHPRFYGTFPRILGRYIREKKSKLSLEEAIYKMTGFPAWRLGLKQRGEIKKNYIADITIFNPEKVIDKATFMNPHQYSEGIEFVLVNGELVVSEGNHTKKTPGKVLRRS
jgi:N-acyl-D-amino-acid deacylase